MHDAFLRRADVDPCQLVLGGDLALGKLDQFGLDRPQLPLGLGANVLVDRHDLHFDLADLPPGPGDLRGQPAMLAVEPHLLALHGIDPRDGGELLAVQLAHLLELLADDLELAALGRALGAETADLLLRLVGLELELVLLAFLRLAGFLEQAYFTFRRGAGIGALVDEGLWIHEGRQSVALGGQAVAAGVELEQLGLDDAELGSDLGRIEPHQYLAALDEVAVLDIDLGDDAAVAVLHLLDVALDHEGAGGHDRA